MVVGVVVVMDNMFFRVVLVALGVIMFVVIFVRVVGRVGVSRFTRLAAVEEDRIASAGPGRERRLVRDFANVDGFRVRDVFDSTTLATFS